MVGNLSEYDAGWAAWFDTITDALPSGLHAEHVGSTSVIGLLAKPVIDVDVVVEREADVPVAIRRLEAAGWVHEGDLGIPGREAFESPAGLPPHHLYLVVLGSPVYRDHMDLRDHLRTHPEDVERYGLVKRSLEPLLDQSRAAYTEEERDHRGDSRARPCDRLTSEAPRTDPRGLTRVTA